MLRVSTLVRLLAVTLAIAMAIAISACARSKSTEVTPASSSSSSSATPKAVAPAARVSKLCSDGVHHPGDHWKEACNPCRCAADGDVTCARFPCPAAPDASIDGGARP